MFNTTNFVARLGKRKIRSALLEHCDVHISNDTPHTVSCTGRKFHPCVLARPATSMRIESLTISVFDRFFELAPTVSLRRLILVSLLSFRHL